MQRFPQSKRKFLETHLCRHRHTYAQHYNCYLTENPENIKIGYFDIETSNLKANFGVILCYCILDDRTDHILHRTVSKDELFKNLDKDVVRQCIEDIKKFDILVGYYSTKFDIPYLRTRANYWGLNFPAFGEIRHKDVYYIIKSKFCLNSNRLETACRAIIGKTEKTHLDANYWIRALQGDRKSLDYILDHCKKDVKDLKKVYKAVEQYVKETFKSI